MIFVGKIRQISVFLYILVLILMLSLVWYDNKVPRNVESMSFLQNYLKNPGKYGGRQVENFGKIRMEVKDGKVIYNALVLKTDKEEIKVERVKDGGRVR